MFNRQRSLARWRPKKIYRSTWVNLCKQLTSLQFDMADPFHSQLTTVKTRYSLTSITWPYRVLKCRTHRGHVFFFFFFFFFFKFTGYRLWIFVGSQAQRFSQIIRTRQKLEAPPLGLAKSIYYKSTELLIDNWPFVGFPFTLCWLRRIRVSIHELCTR